MYCKFCGAQLDDDSTFCAKCGKETGDKPKKNMPKALKIVLAVLGGLVLVAALVAMVYYGLYGTLKPRENDVQYKDNYSISDEKLADKLDTVVATMGQSKLTNRQLQVFYWMHVYNYGSYYDVDLSKDLSKQIMDEDKGLTWQQYFIECAMISWQQYQALANLAQENNYTLPAEYQKVIDGIADEAKKDAEDAGFASIDEMMAADFGKGVTLKEYTEYFRLYYLGSAYFSELVEKQEVTEKEMDDYFAKNGANMKTQWSLAIKKDMGKLVDVRHILVEVKGTGKDDKGNAVVTDADWETCRTEAQKIYDEWLKGEKDESSFADAAYEHSADGNYSDGGLYEDISKGIMVKEFEDWCFDESRKQGDHGMVKTKFGYHIMFYVDGEDGYVRYCRDGILREKADTMLDEILEQNKVEADYKAIALANINLASK